MEWNWKCVTASERASKCVNRNFVRALVPPNSAHRPPHTHPFKCCVCVCTYTEKVLFRCLFVLFFFVAFFSLLSFACCFSFTFTFLFFFYFSLTRCIFIFYRMAFQLPIVRFFNLVCVCECVFSSHSVSSFHFITRTLQSKTKEETRNEKKKKKKT